MSQEISREQFQNLERYIEDFESFVPVAFCLLNQGNIITEVNERFERLTETEERNVRGKKFQSLFQKSNVVKSLLDNSNASSGATVTEPLVLASGKRVIATSVIRKDSTDSYEGHFVSLEEAPSKGVKKINNQSTVPTPSGEGYQKKSGNAEGYVSPQSIIDSLSDGLLFLDKDGCVELANPSFLELFDVTSGEVLNRKIQESDNQLLKKVNHILEDLENDEELKREEIEHNGTYMEVTSASLGENDEQQMIIFHDVSDKKRTEKMKLEFATVAAHQMRTPLSSVRWSLEIISKETGSDQIKEIAQRGYRSTRQVLGVVDELLNVDRIEAGDSGYEFASVDVVSLLQEVVNEEEKAGSIVANPHINFFKPNNPIPSVSADEQKLKIVFKNLIENALKYTEENDEIEIHVTISMTPGYGGDVVQVSVKDRGIGIPKSAQDKIFSKFFRAENATAKQTEGTGVGLFITKQIVDAHNGKIWFESTQNKGATFFVQLPITSRQD